MDEVVDDLLGKDTLHEPLMQLRDFYPRYMEIYGETLSDEQ